MNNKDPRQGMGWGARLDRLAIACATLLACITAHAATVTVDFGLQNPLVLDEGQSFLLTTSAQYQAGTTYEEFNPYHCFRVGFSTRCGDVYGYGTTAGRIGALTFWRGTIDQGGENLNSQAIQADSGAYSDNGQLLLSYADEGSDSVVASVSMRHQQRQTGRDCSASRANITNVVDAWCTDVNIYDRTVTAFVSGVARLDVRIRNVAPTITELNGPLQVVEGELFNLNALATDPGVNDLLTYRWDLNGDGVFDDATGRNAQWRFASAGSHTVAVQVDDGDGGVTRRSGVVEVGAVADPTDPSAVPLPGSMPLVLAGGLLGLASARGRRVAAGKRTACC